MSLGLTFFLYHAVLIRPVRIISVKTKFFNRSVSRAADNCSRNFVSCLNLKAGNLLLSQAVPHQVSSAVYGLTVVFGMGTGVSHRRIVTS